MLGGVFVLLAVMLVPPLRAYLVQQQEYRDLQQSVAEQQIAVEDLQARKEQWNDPAFIERQARDRLAYVRPGETAYVVVGAESLREESPRGSITVIDPFPGEGGQPWYDRVWESVRTGDRLDTDPEAAPVSRLDDSDRARTQNDGSDQ